VLNYLPIIVIFLYALDQASDIHYKGAKQLLYYNFNFERGLFISS